MKIESLKPGQTVWDVARQKLGNTTMSTVAVYSVFIHSVERIDKGVGAVSWVVTASWNGNPVKRYGEHNVKRWRKSKPVVVRSPSGRARLATREELKGMRCTHPNIAKAPALTSSPLSATKKCPDCNQMVSKEM